VDHTLIFEVTVGAINFLMLLIGAWIKADLSALKLYMHQNFISREELYTLLDHSNITAFQPEHRSNKR